MTDGALGVDVLFLLENSGGIHLVSPQRLINFFGEVVGGDEGGHIHAEALRNHVHAAGVLVEITQTVRRDSWREQSALPSKEIIIITEHGTNFSNKFVLSQSTVSRKLCITTLVLTRLHDMIKHKQNLHRRRCFYLFLKAGEVVVFPAHHVQVAFQKTLLARNCFSRTHNQDSLLHSLGKEHLGHDL